MQPPSDADSFVPKQDCPYPGHNGKAATVHTEQESNVAQRSADIEPPLRRALHSTRASAPKHSRNCYSRRQPGPGALVGQVATGMWECPPARLLREENYVDPGCRAWRLPVTGE